MAIETPSGEKTFLATLNYYLPPEQGGRDVYVRGTGSDDVTNKWLPAQAWVRDMREAHEHFSLDTHGFQLVKHTLHLDESYEWTDREHLPSTYDDDIIDLVKTHTKATAVFPGASVIRGLKAVKHTEAGLPQHNYASMVHVDTSYAGARTLRDFWRSKTSVDLDSCRWAIISVWRPIVHTATRSPLAVCDADSVREDELREVLALSNPTQKQPAAGMWLVTAPKTPEQHRWYYASNMAPDEVLLFKFYDSAVQSGVARRTPHSALDTPWDHGESRKSIETRCLLLWEDQPMEPIKILRSE